MDQDAAFLRGIIERPDDDTPRLVYADYLEEHVQPDRAAFVRVQCALARLPESDPRRPELEARERALLREHEEEWVRPLRGLADEWTFRRGFVEQVTFRRKPTTAQLKAVCRLFPIREVITITRAPTTW
jgi:uncharacterized protein (TIGR02996 family)